MPTRWTLVPDTRIDEAVSPRHLHALACALVEGPGSAHTAQRKPFSAAAPGHREHGRVLELGWLDDADPPEPAARAAAGGVHLDGHPFHPAEIRQSHTPYAALADSAPAQRVRVEFTTPAYINRAGRQIPLPDPELLLGALVQRWRAFSPIPLPEEQMELLLGCVHVSRHRIATQSVDLGRGRRVGFTGSATFAVPPHQAEGPGRLLTALWRFAEYAGAGAMTTYGLGRVRVARTQEEAAERG